MSPSSTALNGISDAHSGWSGAISWMRSLMNIPWKYIGCSVHSVPSLSKVAMRSPGAMKSGPPSVVAAVTKSRIACLVGPSFHDGSGSSWAKAGVARTRARIRARRMGGSFR